MPEPSAGGLTFLFTDIEGSTRLWHDDAERMSKAVACHDAMLRSTVETHGGRVVKTTGDGLYAVFDDALDALDAAAAVQRALSDTAAMAGVALRVRCGLHLGVAELRDGDYFGDSVNLAARIMAAAHGGQVVVSESVHASVAGRLPFDKTLESLGPATLRDFPEPMTAYQLHAPGLKAQFPALRSPVPAPHNLPTLPTSFIGREAVIAELTRSLLSERLVTIVGSGGTGKTRVALEVARIVRNRFDDGVWFVELGALADAALVPNAVGRVLEVPEEPGQPMIETLRRHVANRRMLLVLDNCEHLLSGCARLAQSLLAAAPQLRLLATSRAALGTPSERIYPLQPLSFPDSDVGLEKLVDYESVRLFHDRAGLRKPGFAIDAATGPAISEICRRVDGIPLAIELAAARVRSLGVTDIARRLDHRFALLVGGSLGSLPRQQTLRALVDWSYDLLSEPEQALFATLSVFAGGWTLEAVEAVCSDDASHVDLLGTLTNLVEQSLVTVEGRGERYRLLETIREYAGDRLDASDAAAATRARHRAFFLTLAEQAEPALVGGIEQDEWLARLELEHDNLRSVLAQTVAPDGDAEQALRMCGALYRFWMHRGHFGEAHAWCEKAVALEAGARSPARVKALLGFGAIVYRQGGLAQAQQMFEHALSVCRAGDDRLLEARILNNLANVATDRGDMTRALETFEQAAVLAREGGSNALEAMALANLGYLVVAEGDTDVGTPILERALALCREVGDRALMVNVLSYLEIAAFYEGHYSHALALNEQGAEIAKAMNYAMQIAQQLNGRGETLVAMGDLGAARTLLAEALSRAREVHVQLLTAACFDTIARLAAASQEYQRAARIIGVADAMWALIGARRLAMETKLRATCLSACQRLLGEAQTSIARKEGETLSTDAAIDEILAWLRS